MKATKKAGKKAVKPELQPRELLTSLVTARETERNNYEVAVKGMWGIRLWDFYTPTAKDPETARAQCDEFIQKLKIAATKIDLEIRKKAEK